MAYLPAAADRRPPLDALTSLRFVTALHVFLFHLEASRILYAPEWLRPLAAIGYVGVNWFFVLSGFILTYAYAGRPLDLGDFWRARWARVYPAYFASLCIAAPLFIYVVFRAGHVPDWIGAMREHALGFSVLAVALMQAWVPAAALVINPVGWSLSAEAFFYASFPLVLPWMARLSAGALVAMLIGLAAASVALAVAYVLSSPDGASNVSYENNGLAWLNVLRFNPLVRFPEFVLGMGGALLFLRGAIPRAWATSMVGAGLLALFAVVLWGERIPYPVIHNGLLSLPFLAIIYGVALRPRWSPLLEWRPFRALGEVSYSFFLVHVLVIAVFFRPDGTASEHAAVEVLACLAIALAIAFALFRWVEQPMRRRMAASIAARAKPARVPDGH